MNRDGTDFCQGTKTILCPATSLASFMNSNSSLVESLETYFSVYLEVELLEKAKTYHVCLFCEKREMRVK